MTYRDLYPRTMRRNYGGATVEFREMQSAKGSKFLEGIAVPYRTWANIGAYQEQIWESCFVESLQQDPNIPLLLFHDARAYPVGMAEHWTHNPDGLYGRWKMDSAAQAIEAARQASIGHLRLSIGFHGDAEGTDYRIDADGSAWVTRLKARLTEVSLTPVPAYAGARITLARLDG